MPEVICEEAICPEPEEPVCNDCSVVEGDLISFADDDGEWVSTVNEKICRGSCESETKYGKSTCKFCGPSESRKEIIEMTNVSNGVKQNYTVSQVSTCKCLVVDCAKALTLSTPEPTRNVGSPDVYDDSYKSTFNDDAESYYNN